MEAGRGRRDRASAAGKNGLIPLAIFDRIYSTLDVWRQRCAADSIDDTVQGFFRFEPDQAQTVVARFHQLSVMISVAKHNARACREAARRPRPTFPEGRSDFAQQQS